MAMCRIVSDWSTTYAVKGQVRHDVTLLKLPVQLFMPKLRTQFLNVANKAYNYTIAFCGSCLKMKTKLIVQCC